jgi:hypothetical protein
MSLRQSVIQRKISYKKQSHQGTTCRSLLLTFSTTLRQEVRDAWQFQEQAWIGHHRVDVMTALFRMSEASVIDRCAIDRLLMRNQEWNALLRPAPKQIHAFLQREKKSPPVAGKSNIALGQFIAKDFR